MAGLTADSCCRDGRIVNQINQSNKKVSESDVTDGNGHLAFFDQDGNYATGKTLEAALEN